MAFSQATITHTWTNADGTPASGSIEFTLSEEMTNGSVTLVPGTHVTKQLDASGAVSQKLTSNVDPGTFSQGFAQWRVDERIAGGSSRVYDIVVPSGGVSVDLATLMPFSTPPGAG